MEFDIGFLRGILTLILLLGFIGISVWAYSPRQKKNFDQAARLPFDELEESQNSKDLFHKENANLNSENRFNE